MKVEFQHKGSTYSVFIPESKSWNTYHVTKHAIRDFIEEGFDNIFTLSESEINGLREKQIDELSCAIDFDHHFNSFCKKCSQLIQCFESISEARNNYNGHIEESLKKDHRCPRNATYYDKVKEKNYLLIIDNEGLSIIMQANNMSFRVRTAYGFLLDDASEMAIKFRKLYNDSDWRRDQAILRWKKKFDTAERYNNVMKEDLENWEISI